MPGFDPEDYSQRDLHQAAQFAVATMKEYPTLVRELEELERDGR